MKYRRTGDVNTYEWAVAVFDSYPKKPTELRPGKNVILLKLAQNEQKEPWAQGWAFQLRVCDSTGGAVLSTTRPPSKATFGKPEKPASGDQKSKGGK